MYLSVLFSPALLPTTSEDKKNSVFSLKKNPIFSTPLSCIERVKGKSLVCSVYLAIRVGITKGRDYRKRVCTYCTIISTTHNWRMIKVSHEFKCNTNRRFCYLGLYLCICSAISNKLWRRWWFCWRAISSAPTQELKRRYRWSTVIQSKARLNTEIVNVWSDEYRLMVTI